MTRPAGNRRGDGDGGSVLALVPAGFLVMILLAALAVDSAVAYLGQRQLHDAVAAAANDAVASAVDPARFYGEGAVDLDPVAVGRVVCESVRAQGYGRLQHLAVTWTLSGLTLQVSGTARVSAVFGAAIPGVGTREVSAAATAVLASGPLSGAPVAAGPGPAVPVNC